MLIYTHSDCKLKDNGFNHPERKERLDSVIESVKQINEFKINFKEAPIANIESITLVHPREHIKKIFNNIPKKGLIGVEKEPYADTMLCPNSKNAILRSCGAGIAAVDDLMINNENFLCIRPPGHHAETVKAMGFCFINNIAVAAKYLQKKYEVKKVAIIDFDVHHGNGTQEIFYNDQTVLYGSTHEFPLFPGTGSIEEKGVGNIFNAPIKSGTGGKEFLKIFDQKILRPIDKFKPEVILISAGFDAHKRDPLATLNLESEDFYSITSKIVELGNIHSNGRIISFLEGGYDLLALSESIKHHLLALKI